MVKISEVLKRFKEREIEEDVQKYILSEIIMFRHVEEEEIIPTKEEWKLIHQHVKGFSDENFCFEKGYIHVITGDEKQAVIYYHKWLDWLYARDITPHKADELLVEVIGYFDGTGFAPELQEWAKQKVKKIPKGDFDFYFLSAIAADDTSTSLDFYFKAYDIDDTSPWLNYEIASLYFDLKVWEQALKFDLRFIELGKNTRYEDFFDWGYATVRASYYRMKNYKQALFYFKKEVELDNEFKDKDEIFADLYFKLKNYDKCLKHCEIVLAKKKTKGMVTLQKSAQNALKSGKKNKPHAPEFKDVPGIAGMRKETAHDSKNENKFVITPGSERDIENHFYSRIVAEGKFNTRNVKLYNNEGRQIHLKKAGRVDLFLEDTDSGDLILIELKNEVQSYEVIEQITRYKEHVEKHIAKKNQKVCCVVAFYHAKDEFINYAKLNSPFIELMKVDFDYTVL